MIGITLKHLRYLSALAAHEHFGRAAEACSISQPALSIQIKELEAMAGSPLVERSARKVQMTALGQELVERARAILIAVDELTDVVSASQEQFTGKLRLGMIPTMAPYLLPDIMKALGAEFPKLEVLPKEAITKPLIEEILDYRLDAAIVALPIQDPAIREFPLFDEEFVLVRSLQDTDKPVPSAAKLKKMRLLLLGEGHCFRDQALSFCDLETPDAKNVMDGTSLSTLVQMVSSGIGLTLIPEMAIPFETKAANVVVTRFKGEAPKRTVGVIWRKSNPLADQLLKVSEIVRAVAEQRRDQAATIC